MSDHPKTQQKPCRTPMGSARPREKNEITSNMNEIKPEFKSFIKHTNFHVAPGSFEPGIFMPATYGLYKESVTKTNGTWGATVFFGIFDRFVIHSVFLGDVLYIAAGGFMYNITVLAAPVHGDVIGGMRKRIR